MVGSRKPRRPFEATRRAVVTGVAAMLATAAPGGEPPDDPYAEARERMVATIEAYAADAEPALGRRYIAPSVLAVMRQVPRQAFVPERERRAAYADRPLPIGYGQTISQPFIVALMTDMLAVDGDAVVLEVGTGSGYQAAVLSELVREVHTIEIIPELAATAATALDELGYANVTVHVGDGYFGLPGAAPFDGIMVTAAAGQIPPPLIDQLKPGGRMVIPVGSAFLLQYLMLVEKDAEGAISTRQTLPVAFVPLTGGG
jgi:protein-L-isoaspartate(D-aspartate) O-methyltransferase